MDVVTVFEDEDGAVVVVSRLGSERIVELLQAGVVTMARVEHGRIQRRA